MIQMILKWYQNDTNNSKWYVAVCTYEFSTCVVCTVTMFYNLIKFDRLQIVRILLHVQLTNLVFCYMMYSLRILPNIRRIKTYVQGWLVVELG